MLSVFKYRAEARYGARNRNRKGKGCSCLNVVLLVTGFREAMVIRRN